MWTRTWWVRPVSSRHSTSAASRKDIEPLPVRHRALAALAFDDRDLLAVRGRAGERRVDRAVARLRNAGDDREIAPVDRMGGELLRQSFVRDVGLGDDQQARRILVDAVDDARPGDAADARQRCRRNGGAGR